MALLVPVQLIDFPDQPASAPEDVSERLEHLYTHMDLTQQKVNEVIEHFRMDRHRLHEALDRIEHLERRLAGEWPYAEPETSSS